MATSFDKPQVTQVVVPGPASTPTFEPLSNTPAPATVPSFVQQTPADGPASTEKFIPPQANPSDNQSVLTDEFVPYEELPFNQNTLAEDLNARTEQTRRDVSDQTDISVGLYDVDRALEYYFTNVIKPTVLQNGQLIPVDVVYGSPERWSSMQKIGYYRDNRGKLMLPLIMYRRSSEIRNEALVFPRTDKLFMTAKKKWDKSTRYDKFSVLTKSVNPLPNTYTLVSIPNYMVITYNCMVWTAFVEQMNPIIEKINFTDNTYWGDGNRFKFRTRLDGGFNNTVELTADSERMVRTEFEATLYGYLLPKDSYDKVNTRLSIAVKKVVFNTETVLE